MILKRMLSVAIMIVGAFGAFAQQPQMQPLPLNFRSKAWNIA